MHEEVNNMWRWDIKEYGETKNAQKLWREKGLRGQTKGAESAQVQQKY